MGNNSQRQLRTERQMTKMKFQFFYKQWHIYFAFLGLSLIVNSPLIYGYSVMQQGEFVALVQALSFSTSIMVLPIFIGSKTVTKLYLYLLSLFVFVIPLHLLYIYLYHTTQFTPDDIAIMMETDLPEAMGFLRGYGLYVLSTLLLLLLIYRWVLKTILPYRFSTAQRAAALTLLASANQGTHVVAFFGKNNSGAFHGVKFMGGETGVIHAQIFQINFYFYLNEWVIGFG